MATSILFFQIPKDKTSTELRKLALLKFEYGYSEVIDDNTILIKFKIDKPLATEFLKNLSPLSLKPNNDDIYTITDMTEFTNIFKQTFKTKASL